jgi:hypothetical protein
LLSNIVFGEADPPTAKAAEHLPKMQLRHLDLAANFSLRQGLWIEDWQTPPGQECSNGSLILLAVVLWRTLLRWIATPGAMFVRAQRRSEFS